MYAAHTLLKAIGVPGYVVVEKDIADLKVDAFKLMRQRIDSGC